MTVRDSRRVSSPKERLTQPSVLATLHLNQPAEETWPIVLLIRLLPRLAAAGLPVASIRGLRHRRDPNQHDQTQNNLAHSAPFVKLGDAADTKTSDALRLKSIRATKPLSTTFRHRQIRPFPRTGSSCRSTNPDKRPAIVRVVWIVGPFFKRPCSAVMKNPADGERHR